MMEEPNEMYRKFKKFLSGFLIRRVQGEFNADDFAEEKFEYIRPHLEKLLPSLSLTEVMRFRVYFNDVFIFHLTDGTCKPTGLSQVSLSPIPTIQEDDIPPHPKRRKTQSQTEEISGIYSIQTNDQQQTPLEALDHAQRRKTVPLMQSTPLSVPVAVGEETVTFSDRQRVERTQADDFIADIISQINLSPIPQQPLSPLPEINTEKNTRFGVNSYLNVDVDEVPFLRGFADNLKKISNKRKKSQVSYTARTARNRFNIVEPFLYQPKKKKKKEDFATLCCRAQKRKTDEQVKKAEEYFLHFMLVPGKTRNVIKRVVNNIVLPEAGRSHIPMERIINLSNVLRCHASQRQSSVEQPGQISLLHTPQALLRTSQLQPFTPIRGDVSGQSTGVEIDQILNFPTRSVLRQQPLLTIPERDSSIIIPLSPQVEEIPFNNSLNVPQLSENISSIPLDIGEEIASLSNLLPSAISGHNDMIEDQPHTSHVIVSTDNAMFPIRLDELNSQVAVISQNNTVTQIEPNEDNARFNWFEILRPREDKVYPQVDGKRRRKKKRKREREDEVVQPRRIHELPEIPMSPERNNFQNFPVLPDDFSHQITQMTVPNYTEEIESEFSGYFDLIKEAGKNPEYRKWERFDPYLFSENDDFEMYTYIFKRIIKDNFVSMDNLYKKGTSRLEAAKGFRLILELKTMGLIEIDTVDTRIIGFKFKAADDFEKI